MSKFIFTLTLLLASNFLMAQPQYTLTNYAKVDSNYLVSVCNGTDVALTDFLQTGENYNWDYSNLAISTQKDFIFKTRDNSGYLQSFMATCLLSGGTFLTCPGVWSNLSNLVKSQADGLFLVQAEIENYSEFQKTSTQRVEATMLGVTMKMGGTSYPVTVKYTLPDVLLKFPVAMSNKDSSESGFNSDFNPLGFDIIIKRWQKRVNKVDGWGSLVTPYTSFAQTLRMITRIDRIDTLIYNGDTLAMPSHEVLAQWWSPNYGQPVLIASGNQTQAGVVFTEVNFIDTLRCLEPRVLFTPYPIQPIIDATERFVDVTFVNLSQNCTHYLWDFGDPFSANNSSIQKNPVHRYSSGGTYQVKLKVRNEICEVHPDTELTIPLFVADTADVTASFVYSPENPQPNQEVLFDSETQNAYNFNWDFGDGNTSSDINPTHSYSETGEFTVTLTASNTTKSASVSNTIEVLITDVETQYSTKKTTISPNPTSGKVRIDLPQSANGKGIIEVYSISGIRVMSKTLIINGKSQLEPDLTSLSNGVYVISILTNGEVFKGIIVKN